MSHNPSNQPAQRAAQMGLPCILFRAEPLEHLEPEGSTVGHSLLPAQMCPDSGLYTKHVAAFANEEGQASSVCLLL